MKCVSVFMDVEDPINPLADDAALDFPLLFQEVGIRGSFCLTGEKCRTLKARGRTDVRDAYAPHCLGLHTNTHSFHPTTMELLADLSFEEGCKAAFEAEKPGLDAFQDLFGRQPAFWGGGGNTWSPEITDALKRLDIPAYVYALTALPDNAVHKFNGVMALPQALSISEREWVSDAKSLEASRRVMDGIETIGQPWIGIFVGHPTRFRHVDYWDVPYFHGRTPPGPEYTEAAPVETYEGAKSHLRTFLSELSRTIKVVGVDDASKLPWEFRSPDADERSYFEKTSSANLRGAIGWPPHRPGLSPDLIVAKTMALADTVQVGSVPPP